MRLETKRRLAVDAMIDLALRDQSAPVALADIANRQKVCLSCLERLFAQLRTAGLVASTRGRGGGYTLGREAAAISVAAIVDAVETGVPDRSSVVNDLSHRLDAVMHVHMAAIALGDLVAGQQPAELTVDAVRPRRVVVAQRPQPRSITATVPNSVFELGKVMAQAGARPGGR